MYDKCSDCEYGDVENLRLENQELKKRLEVGEEQYNDLVEEKEKLEQENQELKSQLDFIGEQNKYIDKLEKEVKELKELNIAISKGLKKVTVKRNKWRNRYYKVRRENDDQQKEFLEYLKNKERQFDIMGDPINSGACLGISREYKKIIGGKDE